MKIALASEWAKNQKDDEWLIPGLVCDSLTLISGQPKSGKTSLAAHIVRSLTVKNPILGRTPSNKPLTIGWMGFDAKWDRDMSLRLPDLENHYYLIQGANYRKKEEWDELGPKLRDQFGINFLVIDHLYGFGAGANLDKQVEIQEALGILENLINNYGITVLLLTQAGRSGDGRAAHSVASEGFARWLVRIKGTGKYRTLEMLGNNAPTETLKVVLNPSELSIVEKTQKETSLKKSQGDEPDVARLILEKAPENVLKTAKALGGWLATQDIGIHTVESGRSKVNNLINKKLLARNGVKGPIIAGHKLAQ